MIPVGSRVTLIVGSVTHKAFDGKAGVVIQREDDAEPSYLVKLDDAVTIQDMPPSMGFTGMRNFWFFSDEVRTVEQHDSV